MLEDKIAKVSFHPLSNTEILNLHDFKGKNLHKSNYQMLSKSLHESVHFA